MMRVHQNRLNPRKKKVEPKTPAETLRAEYRKWEKTAEETADIKWISINPEETHISLRFGNKEAFSITYPDNYPKHKDEFFFVIADGDNMDPWNDSMQDHTSKKLTLGELLTACADVYLEIGGEGGKGGDDFDVEAFGEGGFDEDGFEFKEEKTDKKAYDAVDAEFADKKFLDIGSRAATLRLIKDLKNIKRTDPKILGFTAEPRVEPGKNIENLYHWIVKLKFDGDLGHDIKEAQKKFSIDHVELEMRFSEQYPFRPPFVRVVRPKFKFHTGHVTVGGSICMELLTNSGWRSTNDIESILIQIRAEMQGGNARLDLSSAAAYSEDDAWSAFYRAAKAHGWDTKDIGPTMFPAIK